LLENYTYLLLEADKSKTYRPTLFDLLSHNALEFYKSDENTTTQPSYQFRIKDAKYLSPSEDFIALDITDRDSVSLQLHALKIYQNLLKFHHAKIKTTAYITVDIERLQFVRDKGVIQERDSILMNTLITSAKNLWPSPLAGLYHYEQAKIYEQEGRLFSIAADATKEKRENRWKLKQAYTLCSEVEINYPNSEVSKKCKALQSQITYPSLSLQAEQFSPVNTYSRILVNYKNIKQLNTSIYRVSKEQIDQFHRLQNAQEKRDFLDNLKTILEF
jgi:hypothetical protein